MRVENNCETCNRIIIRAGRNFPLVNGRISRVNPKNREFAYEVILEDGSAVYVRPDQVVDVLPCPIEEAEELSSRAIRSWLQK